MSGSTRGAGARARARRPSTPRSQGWTLVVSGCVAIAYLVFLRPAQGLDTRATRLRAVPEARAAADAFGRSGRLRMRFALPGTLVDYPIEVEGQLSLLRYAWLPIGSDEDAEPPRSLVDGLVAPQRTGFYALEIRSDSARRVLDGLSLAVMVPFAQKTGALLNGYRIGFYRGERARNLAALAPAGFVEIDTADLELPVSQHLRLAHFVTHDQQSTWPRYAAVDPRLLDKVELVLDEIASWTGGPRAPVELDVHSGFRTPQYNRRVPEAARDSRHQFGDAIDLSIDANQDGRANSRDTRLIALAVEIVERTHPDLAGGMGIYTRRGPAYVHIDARGQRVRWRG